MIAQLTRKTLGLGVSFFACLGFLAVPLGSKTGFQHVKAIVLSAEAQRFARELGETAGRIKAGAILEQIWFEDLIRPRSNAPPHKPTLLRGTPQDGSRPR